MDKGLREEEWGMVGVRVGSRAGGEETRGARKEGKGLLERVGWCFFRRGVGFLLEGVMRLFCSPRSGENGRSGERISWARRRDEPPLQMKSDGGALARSQNS